MSESATRTLLTAEIPGIGGIIKGEVEHFQVEEIPAYEPAGEGPHFFLWVEKRDVAATALLGALAERYGIETGAIGAAGTKDRRGITGQWVSLPAQEMNEEPEPGVLAEGVEVLAVSRHGNKLRTGHLKGNRFRVAIAEVPEPDAAEARIEAKVAQLRAQGMPNYYGEQRFGRGDSTLRTGLVWVQGGRAPRKGFLKKMAASAVQSEVFNRVVRRRLEEGSLTRAMGGDVFEKLESGGKFWVPDEELGEVQGRIDAGELVITGPMPGSRSGLAEAGTAAGTMERAVLEELGLREEDFERLGRLGRGTRRALTVPLPDLIWERQGDLFWFEFVLPAGSYATVLLAELQGRVLAGSPDMGEDSQSNVNG